jgi:Uma2 family endonuclease
MPSTNLKQNREITKEAESMATNPQHSYMTIEEYFEFCRHNPDARYEYSDGQVTMLAGGSLNHATIALNIASKLKQILPESCRPFTSDAALKLSANRCVLPDVTVTCDERDLTNDDYIQYPCLVFEVLSPSTEAIDRGRKFNDYQKCPTLQEYILVNAHEPLVEVFKREKDPMWMYRAYRENAEISLFSLGLSLYIEDIYQGVKF